MSKGFENLPSAQPNHAENADSAPQSKHRIHIETGIDSGFDESIADRQKHLEYVFYADGGDTIPNISIRRDFLQSISRWENELPKHKETILAMRNRRWQEKLGGEASPRPLPALIAKAHHNGDQQALRSYQSFGRALIRHYGGEDSGSTWDQLAEQNKQYVRLGEMTVLAIDSLRAQNEMSREGYEEGKFNKLARILDRYANSIDVPPRFKEKFIDPITQKVLGTDSSVRENKKRAEREAKWRQQAEDLERRGATIHDLWGSPPGANRRPNSPRPPEVEIVSDNAKISGPEGEITGGRQEDVIDMQYNPATDSFESTEEIRKSQNTGEPRKIEYKPGSNSGGGESATPPSPSPGPPSPSP